MLLTTMGDLRGDARQRAVAAMFVVAMAAIGLTDRYYFGGAQLWLHGTRTLPEREVVNQDVAGLAPDCLTIQHHPDKRCSP
jgi:hypothetical protein